MALTARMHLPIPLLVLDVYKRQATNQYSEVGKRMIRLSEHIKEEWLRQKRQAIK